MDDVKREINKIKRTKSDHVKNIVQAYLQKRNYGSINFLEDTKIADQITYSTIETEISQTNSILYSCHNNDPIAIDQNFTKFVLWLKDLIKNKNICHDIEFLVGPLFCHLYLDILKGGNSERAATFLKLHLPSIDKTKCDSLVRDLINLFATDAEAATSLKEQFRSSKYFLELSPQSLKQLKRFISDNCHIVFLHILRTWFDLHETTEIEDKSEERMEEQQNQPAPTNGVYTDEKFQKLLEAIDDLEKEPKQIFSVQIACTKETVNCGVINRKCGIVAFNQNNCVHLRAINSFDNVMGFNCKEIQLSDHTKQVSCIAISPDNSTIVTGSLDMNLCIYSLKTMKLSKKCLGHLGPINCVTVSSNSNFIASGSHDATARLWFLETGQMLRIFVGHSQAVTCIDFHPNCLYLATGSVDRNVRMWSVDGGNPLRLFCGAKGIIYGVAFSPVGSCLAGCGDDKKIRVWEVLNSRIVSEFKCKGEPVTKLAWSEDGSELCSGGLDGSVKVWEVCEKLQQQQQENSDSNNSQEEVMSQSVVGKLLNLEYCFESFACISA